MNFDVKIEFRNVGRGRRCRWCRELIEDKEYGMGILDLYISGGIVGVHFHSKCWDEMVAKGNESRTKCNERNE